MKWTFLLLLLLHLTAKAQTDSATVGVDNDPRVDLLIRKQVQINEETTRNARKNVPGYRILVINSKDRDKVFAAKTKVYQKYPELKAYLNYQPPNYKLNVGNFKTPADADPYIEKLGRIFPDGVYLVHDIIETKLDIPKDENQP
jgi:ribosomal protein S16